MYKSYKFLNKIYLLGYGAIGRPLLYMLLKIIDIEPDKIIVIDKMEKKEIIPLLKKGITFIKQNITFENYKNIFSDVKLDDLIIDCAFNINTNDMIKLCQEKGCHYINSSLEDWNKNYEKKEDLIKCSTLRRHKSLQKINDDFKNKKYNAIVSMGCNPGNVSIWAKMGLEKINENSKYQHKYSKFSELSQKLGVQVIHISERDTQVNKRPKKINEYCNTWSSDGESYFDESLGFVELSYGTHEKNKIAAPNILKYENNFLILNKTGINTYVQSVVPLYGRFIGNLIRHDESYTIGKNLEITDKENKIIYKPSVYYVYHPCNDAKISLEEFKEKDYRYQKEWRLLTDEIIEGRDILGVTYYLENKEVYWIGSILSINEAREIFDNEFNEFVNATIIQVMAGYLGGILYLIELINGNKVCGMMTPEDLPYQKFFNIIEPFLGEFIFKKIDNFYLIKYDSTANIKNNYTTEWQLENFLI